MITDILVKNSLEVHCDPELRIQLENLLNKGSCLINEKKEIWSLREEIEQIPEFSYLIKRNVDILKKHENSDLLAIESQQVIYWLIEKIKKFEITNKGKLTALLFLINIIDDDREFWPFLKNNGVVPHTKLIEFSVGAIESTQLKLEFRFLTDFHTKESQERFTSIIANKNWYDIYEDLHRSGQEFKFEINFMLRQAANVLIEFEFERFLSALENNKDIPFLWGLMDIVGKESALFIANKTKLDILEFSALASALPFPNKDQFNVKEEALLSQMFLKLTKGQDKFAHWMKILNKYPSRYPQIQTSLGKALAISDSKMSFSQYIDAIYLYPLDENDKCRKCIECCLECFEQFANQSLRKSAWELAFHRWDKWMFGTGSEREHIFEIRVSALDYAVTKYYLESLSKIERENIIEQIQQDMFDIENKWHTSHSKLITFWYLCLSQLQPLYHIIQMETESKLPILMTGRTYSQVGNSYIDMFIRG
jgi:hypothetical protein